MTANEEVANTRIGETPVSRPSTDFASALLPSPSQIDAPSAQVAEIIKVATLKPGDTLVLGVDASWSEESAESVIDELTGLLPENKVVVMHGATTLAVVEKGENDSDATS